MAGFAKTWFHGLLVSLDELGAAILYNRTDTTISSLCRLAQLELLGRVEASRWQAWSLTNLAPLLDRIQANHCEKARLADLARAESTIAILTVAAPSDPPRS